MFSNAFQSGFLSIFYSVGSSPLGIWDKNVKNGHIRRIIDEEVKSLVLEIAGTNVATTYITCPIKPRASLAIKLPFLVMVVKNMKKYFTFEIQIIDDKDMRRRFRVSNFQSTTKVRPFCTTMPIGLSSGWNQIQFNLADFTRRAYGTVYMETIRVQVHANVRIRRIYFSDRLYTEDELPSEYKLFMPLQKTKEKEKEKKPKTSSKELTKGSKAKTSSMTKEPVPPSGAPPTPAEPADDHHLIEDEREVAATSVEPNVGDVASPSELDTDRTEAEADAPGGPAEEVADKPPEAGEESAVAEAAAEGGEGGEGPPPEAPPLAPTEETAATAEAPEGDALLDDEE